MMTERNPAPKRRSPHQRQERAKKERRPEETPDTPWRLFIAVPLPIAVRERVAEIISRLGSTDLPARWVDPDNAHLTLHFIGETPPEMAELLRMALGAAVSPHQPFELRTAEAGAFPSLRRPRVLWLGLWGQAYRLEALYNDIGDFLDDFGLDIDEGEFHPHITLGRIRATEGVKVGMLPEIVRAAYEELQADHLTGSGTEVSLPITEVQLLRSHLEQDGPRYEMLSTYTLLGKEEQD